MVTLTARWSVVADLELRRPADGGAAHALVLDGVFTEAPDGTLRFHPAPAPTDMEIARLVATIGRSDVQLHGRSTSADRRHRRLLHPSASFFAICDPV